MDGAFKAAMEVYGYFYFNDTATTEIYTDYNDFRRDQNLMFRFAEAGFDAFMQQQKL